MLEFLRTIEEDADLRLLWKAFLRQTKEEEIQQALLVFTDKLEEVGWGEEANFIRSETKKQLEPVRFLYTAPASLPLRLRMPEDKSSSYSPSDSTHSFSGLTATVLREMRIEGAEEYVFLSSQVGRLYYRYGLPWLLDLVNTRDFFTTLPFLQTFLHLLPIRGISINTLRLLTDAGRFQPADNAAESKCRFVLYGFSPRVRDIANQIPDDPLREFLRNNRASALGQIYGQPSNSLANANHRLISTYTVCQWSSDADTSISKTTRLLFIVAHKLAEWLAAALAVNIRNLKSMPTFVNDTKSTSNILCDLRIDEAMRFRKDFKLLDR